MGEAFAAQKLICHPGDYSGGMFQPQITTKKRFRYRCRVSLAPALGIFVYFVLSSGQPCLLAQQPSQKFVVHVPTKAAVVAPSSISITHDSSDSPQVFPGQPWSITGNALSGTVVEFSVDQAFTHQTDPQSKSDAELSVRIDQTEGPAKWTATRAVDTTSFTQGDEHAVVQVASDAAGNAQVDLGVRFLNNSDMATGDYSITVSCTITIR